MRTSDAEDMATTFQALAGAFAVLAEKERRSDMKSGWKKKRREQQTSGGFVDILDEVMRMRTDEALERIAAESGNTRLKQTARKILAERRQARQGASNAG